MFNLFRVVTRDGRIFRWPKTGPEFQKFSKITRLNREIIITEKIDGTNAQVYITEDGRVFAGSRKRWLTPEHDNYGFAAWVKEHEDELKQLGPGRHYGEWWGKKINRGYDLDHRRFSLFNVSRWANIGNLRLDEKQQYTPTCCRVVPILGSYSFFDTHYIGGIMHELNIKGSRAASGYMKPEGIVILHKAAGQLFKVTFESDEKPKGEQR